MSKKTIERTKLLDYLEEFLSLHELEEKHRQSLDEFYQRIKKETSNRLFYKNLFLFEKDGKKNSFMRTSAVTDFVNWVACTKRDDDGNPVLLHPQLKKNENLTKLEPENDVFPSGCWDDMTVDLFLNEVDVQKKLGVYNESIRWTQCANVNYDMSDSFAFYSETMKDHYNDVKVWVFSGTEDGVLPTLGTLRWIDKLGFNIETKWRQWKVGKQVAGYVQKYEEGLVVVTVKGAGHMVPQDQRAAAYNMVTAFFNGVLP